ncbi:MAG: hypothetical protein Q8911_15350, partial [Bacillota bacterium]|nr:hypothetical protein [Bacillota bacterium]
VAEALEAVYREIAGLLGIAWINAPLEGVPNFDTLTDDGKNSVKKASDYDVILVDGISIEHLSKLISEDSDQRGSGQANREKPLILVCGPISGENSGLRLKTLPFNLGQEGTRLLMEGREYTEKNVGEPSLDLMLEEIRKVLRREVRNYIELPPIPWGYSYAMTLTHDIDILSLKEMPIARTFLGYFYRSSRLNWKRWRAGKVQTSEFLRTLWEMARTWAAKLGLGNDVWQRALPMLIALEKNLEVRSSLYFMPFPGKAGILPEDLRLSHNLMSQSAPANRASFYDVAEHQVLLKTLEDGGWEAGVHGIDAWSDVHAARDEHERVSMLTGQKELGVRMHWLYFQSPHSFKALEEGGFLYDATFGYNEVVGFRAGTLQPYHPLNCQTLWELPLHIQDGALMGEEHLDLNREDAFEMAKPILTWAKRFGGAVSLLWHNQSFTAPRFWGEVYERLIAQGKADGAWIAVPRDVLYWFNLRRKCEVDLAIEGSQWQIRCVLSNQDALSPASSQIPPVRVRLYIDPRRVRTASAPYEVGEDYLDFSAQALITLEVEGEG